MTISNGNQSRYCKAKGRDAENAVCEYLRERGFAAERRRLTGEEDCGDIGGIRKVVIEVKAHKALNLPGWLDELAIEVANADRKYPEDQMHTGLLVIKRKGNPHASDWYCTLTLERMIDLLKLVGFQ